MANESNPGRDQRNVVMQICTSSTSSTSKLFRITNVFGYHLYTRKTAEELQLEDIFKEITI